MLFHNPTMFWRKNHAFLRATNKPCTISLLLSLILVSGCAVPLIYSFEECVAAGYPIMESYPRQCRDPTSQQTFIEEIDSWKTDGIELRQHESEGFYGCFGCSTPQNGPGLCIDPAPVMKKVEETLERFCDDQFIVVES
jgi:hypothetical protein